MKKPNTDQFPIHLNNVRIKSEKILVSPEALKAKCPASQKALTFVQHSRGTVSDIIHSRDSRLLVVCGPCSIHDMKSAKEYAGRLKGLHDELGDRLYILMRTYFEKPRTTTGWKGFINDPDLDGSFEIEKGLRKSRELLVWLAELGLPAATEALDPISPQYLSEFFSWAAIGARTTESQTHREMASGLSMPVGFKNGTDGNLMTAINGAKAAGSPHQFLGINHHGQVSILQTQGNPDIHIILRGGPKPNYQAENIAMAEKIVKESGVSCRFMVDCSHANSGKDFKNQPKVARCVLKQMKEGRRSVIGLMIESHLFPGNQAVLPEVKNLQYGVSITDSCIGWEETEGLLREIHSELSS